MFEPAYFDLLAEHHRGESGHKRLGLRVFVLALDAYRVGGPSLLWDLRRTSRKAQLVLLLLVIAVALTAFMMAYSYPYTITTPYNPSATP